MNIAICENDLGAQHLLERQLNQYINSNSFIADLFFYDSEVALREAMRTRTFSLFFLSIPMRQGDSLLLAHALRAKYKENCELFFLADTPRYAFDCFSVQAAGYFIRPVSYPDLKPALHHCMSHLASSSRYITFFSNRIEVKIPIQSIVYAEIRKNLMIIHTLKRQYQTYYPLDSLAAQLPLKQFLRCHRSYLVNLSFVKQMAGNNFILSNGTEIPIRIREKKQVEQAYQDYLFQQEQDALWDGKITPLSQNEPRDNSSL